MTGHQHSPRNPMRERIAQLAARLMAEDGVQDFALAKRKAARQLGATETRHLPNNNEIERALRSYQELYQHDEQRERLNSLRVQALAAMREFEAFDPHLTGPVLTGTATRYSVINLMLFNDSPKDVELYLLNRNIPFRGAERPYRIGDNLRDIPVLIITGGEHEGVNVTVFSRAELRHAPRQAADSRPLDKAREAEVAALLKASG